MNIDLNRRRLLGAGGCVLAGAALGASGYLLDERRRYGGCGPRDPRLVMLALEDVSHGQQRRRLIGNWKSGAAGGVLLVESPSRTDLARGEVLALAQTGSCLYDVINLDVAWTAEAVSAG